VIEILGGNFLTFPPYLLISIKRRIDDEIIVKYKYRNAVPASLTSISVVRRLNNNVASSIKVGKQREQREQREQRV
jgi:hypothetical protein